MPMKLLAAAFVALAFAAPAAAAPKLTPAERAAITRSIDVFVNHAVKRSNPAAAFDVVAPEMRPGMTRKSLGARRPPGLPVPRRGTTHPWNVLYVTREEVGLELELIPRAQEPARADHLPHLPPARPRRALARGLLHAGRDARAARREEVEGALGAGLRAAGRRAASRSAAAARSRLSSVWLIVPVRAHRRRAARARRLGPRSRRSATAASQGPRGGALPPLRRTGP